MTTVLALFRKKSALPLFGKKKFDDKCSKKYKLLELLGKGGFSEVYLGENLATRKKYAVKCVSKKNLGEKNEMNLEREIEILRRISHPNIVGLVELLDNKSCVYLVMDLVLGGELFDRVVERGSYTEYDASHLVKQVLEAVKYIHSNNIVHRDLKPENLLYFDRAEESRIMLTDFGLAKFEDYEAQKTACGTPGYVAPEVLLLQPYGKPVDCWALGVITYILLCGYPPFYDEDDQTLYSQIMNGDYEFDQPYWNDISESAKDFVSSLIEVDPTDRFTCNHALAHAWISGGGAPCKDIHESVAQQLKKHFDAKSKWKQAVNATTAIRRMQKMH